MLLTKTHHDGGPSILEERPEIEEVSPCNGRGQSPKFFKNDDQMLKMNKQDSEVKSAGLRPSRILG
jgi:hypothetical protein